MQYLINGLAFIGLIALCILFASLSTRPRFQPRDEDADSVGEWVDRLKF
jgi:hypothetical protein